ncbi:MAG: apolipoprotein N-acyltransferase [Desulfobacterota bacterium]|nr:apolipoprotein N-acyltransferase [Thermodesulfobacteriota bacterium]
MNSSSFLASIRRKPLAIVAALFTGVLMAAASPGINFHLLAWICLVPLLMVVNKQPCRSGLLLGWLAGFIFHLGLIYWVVVSMTVYGGLPWYGAVPVLLLFSAFLGLFTAVPISLCCAVRSRAGWPCTAVLPLFWTAFEYIKSWFLTGFPWDNLAHTQFQNLLVIQIADLTGVWGVSFLIVTINCAIAGMVERVIRDDIRILPDMAIGLMLLGGTLGYGWVRLAEPDANEQKRPLRVSMIQPNIPQDLKWDPMYLEATLKKFSSLTAASRSAAPELIVWPESATPFFYEAEPIYRSMLEDIVKNGSAYLLFGSPAYEQTSAGQRFFNSAYLISPHGEIIARYDKIHLVPYGEYVPLKRFFPFIEKMVPGISDFSPGTAIKLLGMPGCRLGTVICYEIIFPDLVRRFAAAGAHAIVNITNDAWFGATSAPVQHVAIAVFRAVENRRWIARCANTGITAFISPQGRVVSQTDIFTERVVSGVIYCHTGLTIYTRYGDIMAKACCIAAVCLLWLARRQRRYP